MNEHALSTSSVTRRTQILQLLEREGEQHVDDMARYFDVSTMTIRRDLHELAEDGRVIRTHGGAAPTARISFEFRFLDRTTHRAAAKTQIAELAASLVSPAQSVMLDSGTTTLAIARRLKQLDALTVITTSLPIASELFGLDHIDLILLGGRLRKDAPDLVGAITDQNLDVLRADVAFIGADAISKDGELFNGSADVGRMLGRMASACNKTYAVADSTKIGRTSLMRFGRLTQWTGLITDAEITASQQRRLKRAGAKVITPRANTRKRRR